VFAFPLGLSDLTLLFAVVAIILLATSEFLFAYTGSLSILVDRRRLRFVGIVFSFLFLAMVGITLVNLFSGR
jgi:hypothetical protein